MVGFICFWIGIIIASIFYYKTDDWRVRKLLTKGYDDAVRDIVEFGFYYNTDNNKKRVNSAQNSRKVRVGKNMGCVGRL